MDKSLGTAIALIVGVVLFVMRPGCDSTSLRTNIRKAVEQIDLASLPVRSAEDSPAPTSTPGSSQVVSSTQPTAVGAGYQQSNLTTPGSLILGSFNIQVFGRAKLSNSDVTAILVDIVRRFDILAIQELRSTDSTIIPRFVELLNADGSRYNYIVGPRQGYTISKEQYVYIYDANKFALIEQPYVLEDPRGTMHRPPLVARFRCLLAPPGQEWTFALLNVHTDPDEVPAECRAMENLVGQAMQRSAGEDDFIILGDLNCPPSYFQQFRWLPHQTPLISDDWPTNTRGNRTYDNLVINAQATAEYRGQSGVMNLLTEYGLSLDQALEVSDHMPIWSVFSTHEAPAATMTRVPTQLQHPANPQAPVNPR